MTSPRLHLYFHTPVPIFKARVNNPGSITYPLSSITYDTVTLGAFADIQTDMTILLGTTEGADDLGRHRVKAGSDADSIPIAHSSKGIEDGQLVLQDNAYITVWDDFRVWAKIPLFDIDGGSDYKDGDIEVGDHNTAIPPVSNCGPGFADYIDSVTDLITVTFPRDGINDSFAVADGATITAYSWDIKDGSYTGGTGATDDVITATFPAGFRWVVLTVTDSNGKQHTSRCPVLAVDPAADTTLKSYHINQRLEVRGQTLDITIFNDMPRTTHPDGTLVMFWWDTPASASDRDHMKFIGWVDSENFEVNRQKTGLIRGTTLHCVDVTGRLDKLPGFPQALSRVEEESPWSYMPSLDMNKSLFYLLFWHSTALDLADFYLPAVGASYNAMRLDASGASLYQQVSSQAQKMVPDHYFTCNAQGQLSVIEDWNLVDVGDRPAASPIITEDGWNNLQADYNRTPKVHVLRSGAILSSTAFVEIDGVDTLPLVFSIAPSNTTAFGQGVNEHTENEGLALSQDDLNKSEGHRYAMLNSRYGQWKFTDPTSQDFWNYEPARMLRVQLNIGAAYAAQRGLDFTTAAGQIKDIQVQYNTTKRGTAVNVSATWVKEVSGFPASTEVPEDSEPVDYVPPVFVPPLPGDPDYFYDNMQAYVMWDGAHVFRTMNIQDTDPTWELVDGCINGDIYDGQYVTTDFDTVGMWLMTTDGIYWCDNILDENLVVNPSEPLPLIATWPNGGSLEIEGEQISFTHSVFAEEAESLPGTAESESDLIIAPPANTVRMVVVGQWSCTNVRSGLSSTSANLSIQVGASGVDATHDLAFEDPPGTSGTGATTGGTFTCEWTWDGPGDWPVNKDSIISSPPGSPSAVGARFNLTALANSGGAPTSIYLEVSITVTEIELDDSTIYTPNCNWSKVLPIETVQAEEETPETGVVGFKTMFNYASQPGFLCVATGPTSGSSNNPNYQHAYFWITDDYGATWTTVDMNSFLRDVGGVFIHGYFHSGLYAMNIYRSAPGTIWCIRETPNIGGDVQIRVFYSEDLGVTWQMGATLSGNGGNVPFGSPSLLNPFPDIDDVSYAVSGLSSASQDAVLQVSTDGWATKSNITTPTGYSGICHLWRPNKRTFDNLHLIAWWHHTAENQAHLLETTDGGANWTLLYDPGLAEANIPNIPGTTLASAQHNTPNGWPPDVNQWVLIRANGTLGDPVVQMTLDNFDTFLDKEGNLATLIPGGWTDGPCDGFALPRVGLNS